jgi:hypothetical protein
VCVACNNVIMVGGYPTCLSHAAMLCRMANCLQYRRLSTECIELQHGLTLPSPAG